MPILKPTAEELELESAERSLDRQYSAEQKDKERQHELEVEKINLLRTELEARVEAKYKMWTTLFLSPAIVVGVFAVLILQLLRREIPESLNRLIS